MRQMLAWLHCVCMMTEDNDTNHDCDEDDNVSTVRCKHVENVLIVLNYIIVHHSALHMLI